MEPSARGGRDRGRAVLCDRTHSPVTSAGARRGSRRSVGRQAAVMTSTTITLTVIAWAAPPEEPSKEPPAAPPGGKSPPPPPGGADAAGQLLDRAQRAAGAARLVGGDIA